MAKPKQPPKKNTSKSTTSSASTKSKAAPQKAASGSATDKASKGGAGKARTGTPKTDLKQTVPIKIAPVTTATEKTDPETTAAGDKPVEVQKAEDDSLRKSDLIKAVAQRASVRNNLARTVVLATLEELGLAIKTNREMKLPGLGRVKYQRVKQKTDSIVTIARIRQGKIKKP